MGTIFSQTKTVPGLTKSEKATLYGLLSLNFLGARPEDFARDLDEKEAVVLLRREGPKGEIVGFSTLMTLDLTIEGEAIKVVFSGDTTVLPSYRNSGGIGVEIVRYFKKTLQTFPRHAVFYILITKGWRTYRVMPFFFNEFSPRHDVPTPARHKAVMDAFGAAKYPDNYDSERGLLIFRKETQRLKPDSIDALPARHIDEHTAYFLRKNPTYLSGTELVCVGSVVPENFAPTLKRLVR